MAGCNLKFGEYKKCEFSDKTYWNAFENVFSENSVKSASYKYVFLKSILDCMSTYKKEVYSFYELFERFTEIYWVLVIKYGLSQNKVPSQESYIEQLLKEYALKNSSYLEFKDLPLNYRNKSVLKVIQKCTRHVVGALYEDTEQLFYSFSKKDKIIVIKPEIVDFVNRNREKIERLNYYEFAKFLDKINIHQKAIDIKNNNLYNLNEPVEIYNKMLWDEFGE